MKIALDFDETFTEAPSFWKIVVAVAKTQGHEIKFVTYRDFRFRNRDITEAAAELGIDVIFTGGKQKSNFYDADVWIDDSPVTIPNAIELGTMYDSCLIKNDMDVR